MPPGQEAQPLPPLKSGWASIVKKDQPAGSSPRSGIVSPPAGASPTAKSAAARKQGFAGSAAVPAPANRQNSSESSVSEASARSAPPSRTSGPATLASGTLRAGAASAIPAKEAPPAADATPAGSSPLAGPRLHSPLPPARLAEQQQPHPASPVHRCAMPTALPSFRGLLPPPSALSYLQRHVSCRQRNRLLFASCSGSTASDPFEPLVEPYGMCLAQAEAVTAAEGGGKKAAKAATEAAPPAKAALPEKPAWGRVRLQLYVCSPSLHAPTSRAEVIGLCIKF